MAKFDFDKPVASFSWYLQNGSADDKRGNRLHVGTGQKAQIYFDPESGEFIGKLKYVDDYIDLADGAKQHFELPRTAREYKPSDFSPKFPISNVKFEVDESVKDFIHVLPRGLSSTRMNSTIPSTVSISTPKSMGWAMSHISRYMMCRSQTSRNVWPGAQNTSMWFPDRSMS